MGAVIVERDRLLLIERGRGPAIGQWSVPGGRVEPGESLAAAVEREVLEETGLSVSCGRFIGWVERISGDHHYVIMDFQAARRRPDELAIAVAGDDAADVAWVPLPDLADHNLVAGLYEFLTEHGVMGD